MHGEPALPRDFDHLPYADPARPKAAAALGFQGTFDSLNPYNLKAGSTAQGLERQRLPVADGALGRRAVHPLRPDRAVDRDRRRPRNTSTSASIRARASPTAADHRRDVALHLRPAEGEGPAAAARRLRPGQGVETPDALTSASISPASTIARLPLILALMPVLSKHTPTPRISTSTTLQPPIGTGPYGRRGATRRAARAEAQPGLLGAGPAGRAAACSISTRSASTIIATPTALFEAFKAGLYDYRVETDPTRWLTGYDFPAVRDGRIVKRERADRPAEGHGGLRLQHPPAALRRRRACARRWR